MEEAALGTEAQTLIAAFLDNAQLSPPHHILPLAKPARVYFRSSLPVNSDAARTLLAQQRINEPGEPPPERHLRHKLSKLWLKEKSDQAQRKFSKHEVAKAFDSLLCRAPLAPPGVAQALLDHAPGTSTDELWQHLHDAQLEKRTASRFRRSRPSLTPRTTWLDVATRLGSLDYIHLICQAGVGQDVLDEALHIALFNHSTHTTEVLLSYGAIASVSKDIIRECFIRDDIPLARLLLSAPNSISIVDWRYCIAQQVSSCPIVVVLCLAQHPTVASGNMLLEALKSGYFDVAGILLACIGSDQNSLHFRTEACRLASLIRDNKTRCRVFAMLASYSWVKDSKSLQSELMKDVKLRQVDLVRILTDAGVTLDTEPNNAVSWAISQMDLEILKLFGNGTFASPSSPDLTLAPDTSTEQEMLQLLDIFRDRLSSVIETLHSHLIRATRRQRRLLVRVLMGYGASAEFQEGAAIRTAILKEDFEILGILIQGRCSPDILSTMIPTVVALKSKSNRLRAMESLVKKGVLPDALGWAVKFLLFSKEDPIDLELMKLLLEYMPSNGGINNHADGCILAAARLGNLPVLAMLCEAGGRVETMSKAVPLAFQTMHDRGYDVALGVIKLLLEKGAAGVPIHDALLAAALQDRRLDIVRILLNYNADANHNKGAAFAVALKTTNLKLLDILCKKCPPTSANLMVLLSMFIDPQYYSVAALELLLGSAPSTDALESTLEKLSMLASFKDNPNITTIIPCFLRHGLDVDVDNGSLLRLAVQKEDMGLLKTLLSANPCNATLQATFRAAVDVLSRKAKLEMMELLLWQAESAEIGQSEFLLGLTQSALAGDPGGLKLVLRHRAAVDFNDGKAVQMAAIAGDLEVLDMLLSSRPTWSSISRACSATGSSALGYHQKLEVFKRLLTADHKASTEDLSALLAESIARHPKDVQLPTLLLARGAVPDFVILKFALEYCSQGMYITLLSKIQDDSVAQEVFRLVRSRSRMPGSQRYQIYQHLLTKRIPSDEISGALLGSLSLMNLDLPKLLLEHGAAVGYNEGKAFHLALYSDKTFKLLTQYIKDDHTAGIAFDLAVRMNVFKDPREREELYRHLLHWNIPETSLSHALEDSLKEGKSATSVVQLLLRKGADANVNNGRCVLLACIADAEPQFRALCRHAKLDTVLQILLAYFQEEGQVVQWFNICLEERPPAAKIEHYGLLFECLSKFPNGTALLKLVLDNGVPASAMKAFNVYSGGPPEQCTALLWALLAKPEVGTDAILALVARGRHTVLPAYSAPRTGVSAAFACLLDKSRTPVLKALLDLDKEHILPSEIPGASFGYLSGSSSVSDDDLSVLPDRLSLHLASIYLGNFEAYSLVRSPRTANDGLLHLVSFLALPRFVKWLLKTDDPNYKEEEFDNRIPLAVVCDAKPLPWCKVANEESDFKARQRRTMQLLAAKCDLKWRYRGKTVLHIALENGVETTSAMMHALKLGSGVDKQKRYRYTDKNGKEYSLHEYVMEFVDGAQVEKKALVNCLNKGGLDAKPKVKRDVGARRTRSMAVLGHKKVVDRRLSSLDLAGT